MPRVISPGPAGLKFWRAPGLAGEIVDIYSLPAGVGDQFNPWGPKRPVQDWVWGNPCLYPPTEAATFAADAGSYALTGSDAALTTTASDTTNLPAGMTGGYVPWRRPHPIILRTGTGRVLAAAAPVTLTADGGNYTLTGTAAAFVFGQAAGSGSYSITGSAAALALRHTAGSGSYSLTGAAAAFVIPGGLAAAAGSYTITGTAAGLMTSGGIAAAAGSYAITGSVADFVIPGAATYLPAGMTGGFNPWRRPHPISLRTGTGRPLAEGAPEPETPTHLPAGAVSWFNPWGRRFPVNLRTSTGRPLAVGPATLPADAGSYIISGASATLALRLTANSGSYTVSGSAAVLARGFAAGAGAYAITGTDADLRQAGTITLTCGAGAYLISGSDAALTVSITPPTVTPPPAGGVGVRVGRYKTFKLKKKRKHDQCEELLEYLRSLPSAEAEAAVAELPPSYLSLLDGLPLPHALVLPPVRAQDEDDDDECALLLEMLLS